MNLADFDFELPETLIAQELRFDRSSSRMLLVDRLSNSFRDERFIDLPELLLPGDLLVLNNTTVFPARLLGTVDTGASVEIFLLRELGQGKWEVLAKPARRLKVGKRIDFQGVIHAVVRERFDSGKLAVVFEDGDLEIALNQIGKTPLPPYIKRDRFENDRDRDRYQTVFAQHRGAIAAPTAGLHFTPEILNELRDRGIEICEITLHVGYGTFEPVGVEDLSKHSVLPERYEISVEAASALNTARSDGRRIVAVGTTSTRTLEAALTGENVFVPGSGMAQLTITPGYRFNAVGAMLTNFHLPRSSLLILVSTFSGHELIMESYQHAVAAGYRFYSYGDCMLIV